MAVHNLIQDLKSRKTGGGVVVELSPGCWRLSIPAGPSKTYRWAQLDDYLDRRRVKFLWKVPFRLDLKARVSAANIPGTWGFGFWNDPFNFSFNIGGAVRRLPALPNAAWFFYASPPNHLALRPHPGDGLLAAGFSSPLIPAAFSIFGLPVLPFMAWPPSARLLLRAAQLLIHDDAVQVEIDPTEWHTYSLEANRDTVLYSLDGEPVFESPIVPGGPLGLVIWIDNQYAALHPEGKLGYGTLPSLDAAWLEVQSVEVQQGT